MIPRTPIHLSAVAAAAMALAGCGGVGPVTAPDTDATPPPITGTETTGTTTAPLPDPNTKVLVERPAGFPNKGEAFMLARLHPQVARRCTRAKTDTRATGSVAGLACDTERAYGVTAYYDLFPSRAAMEAAYGRYRRANGVPLEAGTCFPPVGKRRGAPLPAEGPWRAGGTLGAGRAMCVRAGDRVWLVTDHPARMIAYLAAPTRQPLVPFWRTTGAPTVHPRPATTPRRATPTRRPTPGHR